MHVDSEPEGRGRVVKCEMSEEWKVCVCVCVMQVFVYLGFKDSRLRATFHFDGSQFNVSYFQKSKQVHVLAVHQNRTHAGMLDCCSK